jgi:FMN phosphatase YigB (HAD superfamily)
MACAANASLASILSSSEAFQPAFFKQLVLAALEPLNERPENAAFVGHAKIEIDGAKAIGLTTIIFNPDPDCKESDYQIEKFKDLLKIPPILKSK